MLLLYDQKRLQESRIINLDLASVIKKVNTCLADNRKQTGNHLLRNSWTLSELKRHSFKRLLRMWAQKPN